jgi:hypothetical protein
MKRERHISNMKVRAVGASRAMLMAMLAAFAATAMAVACAESGEAPPNIEPDASSSIEIPDSGADRPDTETDVDAGCAEPDSSKCTTAPEPCEDVDWCPSTTPADPRRALTAVWGTSKNDVWAVGSAGTILHFDGSDWKSASVDTTRTLFSVGGSGPDDVWVVGTYGTLYHGPGFDAGTANWKAVPIVFYAGAAEKTLTSVWGASPDDIWIAGESLKIPSEAKAASQYRIKSLDGGFGWEAISPCATCTFVSSVWGTSPSDVWSVGQGGKTFHTSVARPVDGGDGDAGIVDAGGAVAPGWIGIDSQTKQDLLAVWGSSKDDIWTVGRRGTIRRYLAGAPSWEVVQAGATEDLHGVWGSAEDDVWVVGDYGTILHFDGTGWQISKAALPVGVKPHLYGVWGSAKDDVWIVGEGIVLHFTGAKK